MWKKPDSEKEGAPEWQKVLKKLEIMLDNASGGLLITAKESAPADGDSRASESTPPDEA